MLKQLIILINVGINLIGLDDFVQKWQARRKHRAELKQQRLLEETGEPAFIIDHQGQIRAARLRRHGRHLMIQASEITDTWIEANPNGTINVGGYSYLKRWYTKNQAYSADKVLNSILKCKEVLPILMGIDRDLDKLIEQELRS
jgi:hypothetical protein